ncbi:TPA: TIGR00159 family protein [bacterium]|nr:TIGR00159 family protein [bacterium]
MLNIIKYIGLRILTIIDILAVAFIFYKAFMLIRGTRAIQALKGIAILIVITAISALARLETLNWLLQRFWTWGVVAFVILFAPELKSALARMGSTSAVLGLSGNVRDEKKYIQEVVDATERLSAIRAGALIAISRQATLETYIESGVPLDSEVSRELIMTIFYPDTELHDGAVIIRNGRIVAAGCTLPLSQSSELEQSMGTRHRAGIGLTEETDAIVIIVSEESGAISMAVDGKITRYLNPQTLNSILVDYLVSDSQRQKVAKDDTQTA